MEDELQTRTHHLLQLLGLCQSAHIAEVPLETSSHTRHLVLLENASQKRLTKLYEKTKLTRTFDEESKIRAGIYICHCEVLQAELL